MANGRNNMKTKPKSPIRSSTEVRSAVAAWVRGRKARSLVIGIVFMVVCLVLLGARHPATLRSYKTLSSSHYLPFWQGHLSDLPAIAVSPLKPSNITLELENGEIEHIPSQLKKGTPNFHLIMTASEESEEFCKTTMSTMILNYPPPTLVGLPQSFDSQAEREKARLGSIRDYIMNEKLVNDNDLILIVDGQDTWFQLPSEIIIQQYQTVVADANKRLLDKYGINEENAQRYNLTIVFGAEKTCVGEYSACRHAPNSTLPSKIYGKDTGKETALTLARYLDSGVVMGPAKDLSILYDAAVNMLDAKYSNTSTAQSIFTTMFAGQHLAREAGNKTGKLASPLLSLFKVNPRNEETIHSPDIPYDAHKRYEFSIGLDYTSTLFQSFLYPAPDELIAVLYDNSTDLSTFHHSGTTGPPLELPIPLQQAKPPFWTPGVSGHNPNPSNKPSVIEPLRNQEDLDNLPPYHISWASIPLIQNTYTGSIPAIFRVNASSSALDSNPSAISTSLENHVHPHKHNIPTANISWSSLWYANYSRALLRRHLRIPQSPLGFHIAAVGGDLQWDVRGGGGGIWTYPLNTWLPWGELDGVCGKLDQLNSVFNDGKGVWLHEKEENAEEERRKQEKGE